MDHEVKALLENIININQHILQLLQKDLEADGLEYDFQTGEIVQIEEEQKPTEQPKRAKMKAEINE